MMARPKNRRKQATGRWKLPQINWRALGICAGGVLGICAAVGTAAQQPPATEPEEEYGEFLARPGELGSFAVNDIFKSLRLTAGALSLGKKTTDLTEVDLPALRDVLLKMKQNAKLVGEVTASQTALATGEVDILVGGGEWVTAGLATSESSETRVGSRRSRPIGASMVPRREAGRPRTSAM